MRALEVEMELNADTVAVAASLVAVCEAPDVVHTQDCQDIVKTNTCFHVGLVAHRLANGVGRELENIIAFQGIIFIA